LRDDRRERGSLSETGANPEPVARAFERKRLFVRPASNKLLAL
jgi:hypothetical protein